MSEAHPELGYPKISQLLKGDGWEVGKRLVQRLRQEMGLQCPRNKPRRPRTGVSTGLPTQARHRNHVRTCDFISDRTARGDSIRMLTVLDELSQKYCELPEDLQRDIVLINLPMASTKENALMVNALQRCSTVVVQNSIREGFGLTIAEAMWKRTPVVSTRSCGARQQLVDRLEGRLVKTATDPLEIATVLDEVLAHDSREIMASNAQRRVHREFLIFSQLQNWLRTFFQVVS